ncbi:MAG: cold shock domain-containing protein [Candidatus Electrothrix sp. AR4]|nr:cold shock domain-containing protein [Candidatus Electrothrix sp. AR4]
MSEKYDSIEGRKEKEGKLIRWNDDKGFGFIKFENKKRDVFLHISALKNASRRPVVGDIVFYRLSVGKDKRYRAVDARIQGVVTLPSARKSIKKKV